MRAHVDRPTPRPAPPARRAASARRPSSRARARCSSGPTARAAATRARAAGPRSSSRPDGADRSSSPAASRTRRTTAWSSPPRSRGCAPCPAGGRACVVTDSRLMIDSMTRWLAGWKRKGWRTAGGDPVKNQDLVRALDAELARHAEVRWHWVRGHETGEGHGHKALNDRADRLAVAASTACSVRGMRLRDALRHDPGGPSFAGLEPDATPKAPGGERRTMANSSSAASSSRDLQERLYAEAAHPAGTARVLLVLQGMDTSGKGGASRHASGWSTRRACASPRSRRRPRRSCAHHFLWRIRRALPAPGHDRRLRPLALRGRPDRAGAAPGPGRRDRAPLRRDQRLRGRARRRGRRDRQVLPAHLPRSSGSGCWRGSTTRPSTGSSTRATSTSASAGPTTRTPTQLALERCSTEHAPWYVVPADRKWYRNWAVGRLLMETLRELDPQYPRPDLDVEGLERRLAPRRRRRRGAGDAGAV